MDSQEQRNAVKRIVDILRRLTRIFQILPFAYLFFLSVYLLTESLLPEWALRIADNLVDIPIYLIIAMLFCGNLLKLCAWYRTACVMPLAVKAVGYIDSFIIEFTQNEVVWINAGLGILFLLFLGLAYKHFFL